MITNDHFPGLKKKKKSKTMEMSWRVRDSEKLEADNQ